MQQQQQQEMLRQQQQQQPMYGYDMQQQQQQQPYINGSGGYPGYPMTNGLSPQQQSPPTFSAVDPESETLSLSYG